MTNFPIRSRFMSDIFNDLTDGFFIKPLQGEPLPNRIAVDITENEKTFEIQAELPGVKKEDIHVDLHGATVNIKAEIKQEKKSEDNRVLRTERYVGSVARRFELPVEIDVDQASADYQDGVLTLSLPKKDTLQGARKLQIK